MGNVDVMGKACSGTFFHSAEVCYRLDGMKKLVFAHFSIAQKNPAAWMERQAWKKSGKQRFSILAEIIDVSMVSSAKSSWENIHHSRDLSIYDV